MPLAPGVRLGPYEIVAPIGAGGMGEVWRARDPRLGREVAVKVLPAGLGADAGRLARFQHEALAAGALNHPNVLSVYDVGEHEGAPYLVFELLDGKTLRERLAEGPVTPRRAAEWAAQVARGLASAHDKGILHRDLKPENLFVLADGRVKILDFGLAKLGPLAGEARLGSDVATASQLTQPGTILGTVAYMSPEQVRGSVVDHRSDLFSLGVVLHELLTGRRPWVRDTPAETMSAILKEDPPDLASSGIVPGPMLDRIVRRCLEKEPAARFRSAHDLAFALESAGGDSAPSATPLAPGLRRQRRVGSWLVAAALVAVAAGGYVFGRRATPSAPPAFEQVTFRRGTVASARFTADGHTIVYGAAWEGRPDEVFSTRLGGSDSRPLGLSPATLLALSSTGEMALSLEPRWIFSYRQPGILARAPLAGGGAPHRLLADVNAADWSPDGSELAVARFVEGGSRIEFPLGKVLYQTKDVIGSLRISPEGRRLAFIEYGETGARVMTLEEGGSARALSVGWKAQGRGLAWLPSGREVLFSLTRDRRECALTAVDLGGRERLILQIPGGLWLQDVARDGRVLIAHFRIGWQMRTGETAGASERDLSWFTSSFVEDMTPDGRQLLFLDGQSDLYLRAVDGSPAVNLGSGFGGGALSPDGSRVAAIHADGGRLSLVATREGETVVLPPGPIKRYVRAAFMPDGHSLLVSAADAEGRRVFLQDVGSGLPRPVTPVGFDSPCPSPDGTRFATSDGKGHIELYPTAGGPPTRVPGDHMDRQLLRWSADGRSVFAYRQGDLPGRIYRIDLTTGAEEVVRTLMPPDPTAIFRIHPVVVTADGRHYAYGATQNLSDLYVYSGLR